MVCLYAYCLSLLRARACVRVAGCARAPRRPGRAAPRVECVCGVGLSHVVVAVAVCGRRRPRARRGRLCAARPRGCCEEVRDGSGPAGWAAQQAPLPWGARARGRRGHAGAAPPAHAPRERRLASACPCAPRRRPFRRAAATSRHARPVRRLPPRAEAPTWLTRPAEDTQSRRALRTSPRPRAPARGDGVAALVGRVELGVRTCVRAYVRTKVRGARPAAAAAAAVAAHRRNARQRGFAQALR